MLVKRNNTCSIQAIDINDFIDTSSQGNKLELGETTFGRESEDESEQELDHAPDERKHSNKNQCIYESQIS